MYDPLMLHLTYGFLVVGPLIIIGIAYAIRRTWHGHEITNHREEIE
jgi:hypothetical protein